LRKLSQENPEKLKEYRKKAYLRRKEKIQNQPQQSLNQNQ